MRIAIDTGGTFTDCVYSSRGELNVLKIRSTPAHPENAVLQAIREIAPGQNAEIRHGTTVGTNTLLERKGARVAFVTTAGFEDSIAIGRQARPRLYDLLFTKDPPLAPEDLRFGVNERTTSDGSILHPIDTVELARLAESIRAQQPDSIAISLLFAFANPSNEKQVAERLRELNLPLTASHELLPEFREYERASTVVINAYLAPKMQRYLQNLDTALRSERARLLVMQSSGGIIPAAVASREPVRTILSGPAGGVVGAAEIATSAGFSRILAFDMGGTSTDVSLLDGKSGLRTTTESRILDMPVAVPMLDIHTVGAGGGSLASFDRGGALKVGPESAGADPGPICYGRGEQPTVTDADLLLGRLDPDCFLGGDIKLDESRARNYFDETKGTVETAERFAEGIIRFVNGQMQKALRTISVERGRDPREFVLVSFGGAGPLHACALARSLGIPKVLVPAFPGALSAYGILVSDIVRDYSRTVMLKPDDPSVAEHFEALEKLGTRDMQSEGLKAVAIKSIDMRYAGQGYELAIDWSEQFATQFHKLHEQRYGYADPHRPIEIVNARVRMIAHTEHPPRKRRKLGEGNARQALVKQKPIYFEGQWRTGTVYDRARLVPGDRFNGPSVIVEYSATTFLAPGASASVDEYANLILDPRAPL